MFRSAFTIRKNHLPARGSALVVALAAIALLTAVILAFVSFTAGNMRVEESRTDRKDADVLAVSGGAYVTSLFLQELATNSTISTGGAGAVTNYLPNSPTNMVPARLLGDAITATDPNYYNLIRQSVPATDPNTSSDSTSLAAANGRSITLDRWNRPVLLGGAGLTTAQVPNWIYVDRLKGAVNAASTNSIGRFAYNVYDIGGLLDVNAAGFPNGTLSGAQISALKGTPSGADLTQLPGINTADVVNLITFRNAGTASTTNYTAGQQGAERAGFLSSVFTNTAPANEAGYTNNYFFSRQDLLRYADTQNTDLTNALPYLTTFSRNVTAPSWMPQTPAGSATNYATLAAISGSTNRIVPDVCVPALATITHYNDDASTNSYTINPGNPLVQRRFSLAKLAWLTSQGPATNIGTATSAQMTAAIQACFGLTWVASTESWTYQDNPIKTLDQVAALSPPREPNFFELLKAGILKNSVGTASVNGTGDSSQVNTNPQTDKQLLEAKADMQIGRIGADIIDNAKSDNVPTTIKVDGFLVHGVQDLPYFYGVIATVLAQATAVTPATTPVTANLNWGSLIFVPLLFNPNALPATPATTTPTQFQIVINSQATLTDVYLSGYAKFNNSIIGTPLYRTPNSSLSGTTPIAFSFGSEASDPFRAGISPINSTQVTMNSPNTGIKSLVTQADSSLANLQALLIYNYTNLTPKDTFINTGNPINASGQSIAGGGCFQIDVTNTLIELEYKSPYTQQWRVYDTLMGNDSDPASGINKFIDFYPGVPFAPQTGNTFTRTVIDGGSLFNASAYLKFDPRTSRFGICFAPIFGSNSTAPIFTSAATQFTQGMQACLPFGSGNAPPGGITFPLNTTSPTGVFPGLWAQGGTTGWSDTSSCNNVADTDGVVRPADGWLGTTSGQTTAGPGNLFQFVNVPTLSSRPQLLHRPFQSVGELGYVFRDSPWKSLNLFDPSSGDGGLLDLFSVVDEPAISSGRVSLNTRQPLVLQSLLNSAALNASSATPTPLPNPATIAGALSGSNQSYAMNASGNPQATAFLNLAQLPNFMGSSAFATAYPVSSSAVEYEHEAVVRALAGTCQTRTWNLLIDVIAQTGKFPSKTTTGGSFLVQGEKHYWLSIAIDRFTGKVVDQQLEAVDE